MTAKPLLLAATLLLLGALPAAADPHPRCFSMSEMNGWRSPDGKAIYLRAGANRYYRLDLARQCGTLKSIDPHLVLTSHTGGMVCSAIDLDVKAADSPGGIVEPCFPKTLTELSAAEAAALPKGAKP
ncbi:MAG TPA: DUF6491 family protein [Rhizomicrobium sp.]|jgi:hypothetical protein|nr:DUF6491 family protein [Rhizomicrobium sp.]